MKVVVVQFEEYPASFYGIGTFVTEYLRNLQKNPSFEVICLRPFSQVREFTIKEFEGVTEYCIPAPFDDSSRYQERYARGILFLLRMYLDSAEDMIFSFQSSNAYLLLKNLKKHFPRARTIFTIHYLTGVAQLNGQDKLFGRILAQYPESPPCPQLSQNQPYQSQQDDFRPQPAPQYPSILPSYRLFQSLFALSDHIVSLSEDTKGVLEETFGVLSQKIVLIPNGLEDTYERTTEQQKDAIRQKLYLAPTERIILFVGRVMGIKGVEPLLAAFNQVVLQYPGCRLVLIGDIYESRLTEAIRYIWSKVTFTGRMEAKEVRQWYRIADVGVTPSYYEECSYVGMEMMMHGLPIVASDGYSVKNMFYDGENALVARIGDVQRPKVFEENLAEALLRLLRSDELRQDLGRKSRAYYLSHYRAEIMRERYHAFFKDIQLSLTH